MTCNVQQQQQSQQRQQHSTTAGGRWKNGGGGKEIIRQLEESSDQRPDCYNVHSDNTGTSGVWSPHWAMVTSSPGPRGKVRPQIGSGGLMNHKETFILSLARHNMMKYKTKTNQNHLDYAKQHSWSLLRLLTMAQQLTILFYLKYLVLF